MLSIYFSGTGNTKYCAERFANNMNAVCYSIETDIDFGALIADHEQISFFYPIYGSYIPRIMREFVRNHKSKLNNKQIIIICDQLGFSGDGARVFVELLEDIEYQVIYAEHINMPNNLANVSILPVKNGQALQATLLKANKKIDKASDNIKEGIVVKRGFSPFSKYLGLWSQRAYFSKMEKKATNSVRISEECIACGQCCEECPMDNLLLVDGKVQQQGNCTVCYRCVNLCPTKAITVWLHSSVRKEQYHGIPKIADED